MKTFDHPEDTGQNHGYIRKRRLLIQQLDREIFLPFECQRLLASCLGARREDCRGDGFWGSSFFRLGSVRRLDVIHVDLGNLDIFGLELAAETGTVKASAEDGGLIGIHVYRNLVLPNGAPHSLLDHRRSGGAARQNDGRDIFLQGEISRRRETGESETHKSQAGLGQTCVKRDDKSDIEVTGGGFEL